LRSAFHLSQCWTKLRAARTWQYGRFDVVHVTTERSSEDYAPQLRQQCVVKVWYHTQVRAELAAAAPTQRRRRPLADEYKCKEQGRDHTRAYGNARRVSRHSLRPHLEPASSRLPLNRFKSLKSKLINVMKILQRGAKYCNVASNLKLSEQNRF